MLPQSSVNCKLLNDKDISRMKNRFVSEKNSLQQYITFGVWIFVVSLESFPLNLLFISSNKQSQLTKVKKKNRFFFWILFSEVTYTSKIYKIKLNRENNTTEKKTHQKKIE